MDVCVKMELYDEEDYGLEGLTQVPKLEDNEVNFNVGFNFIEEDLVQDNIVSLEENESERGIILYDNVRAEDISSDEEIDRM